MRRSPQDRGTRRSVGQGRAERPVQHNRSKFAKLRIRSRRGEKRSRELCPTNGRGRTQRRVVGVGEQSHRFDETGVDLRFWQRVSQRIHDRTPQMEHVVRKLEVEERRLVLLVLRLRRQHVVGEPGGFGEGNVDDNEQLQ